MSNMYGFVLVFALAIFLRLIKSANERLFAITHGPRIYVEHLRFLAELDKLVKKRRVSREEWEDWLSLAYISDSECEAVLTAHPIMEGFTFDSAATLIYKQIYKLDNHQKKS